MRPTPRLLWWLLAWTGLGLLLALNQWLPAGWSLPEWQPQLTQLWRVTTTALLILALFDILALRRLPLPQLQRIHNDALALGVWTPVQLQIRHQLRRPQPVVVFDHYPPRCQARHSCQQVTLQPGQGLELGYEVKALVRGNHRFGGTDLLLQSPLGLWQRRVIPGSPSTIKVFPNFAAVANYAMMSMEQQASQLGIRLQQRRGEGMEFQQLREFRQGDSLRQIDWNATARQRKLISKEYQDERDQQILFLVDCGRRMRSKDGPHSHLDHALNAMLLMSYAALKQGDAVGLMCFGGADRWLQPIKGVANLSRILNCVYDMDATTRASDYHAAIRQLMSRHSKRALVVLLSNIRDENVEELKPALKLLQKKHLVMIANLEEPELQQVLTQPVHQFRDALQYAGSKQYLDRRQRVTRGFNREGLHTVNATPQMMPVALINQYFEIKREGLL